MLIDIEQYAPVPILQGQKHHRVEGDHDVLQ